MKKLYVLLVLVSALALFGCSAPASGDGREQQQKPHLCPFNWADTENERLCLDCGELGFVPYLVFNGSSTGAGDDKAGGTVLIKGTISGGIVINNATQVYIANGTIINNPSGDALTVPHNTTIFGGGNDIAIIGSGDGYSGGSVTITATALIGNNTANAISGNEAQIRVGNKLYYDFPRTGEAFPWVWK